MKHNPPKWVTAFIQAVYPEAPDLAIASFNEVVCIKDATKKIRQLEAERDALKRRMDELERWGHAWEKHNSGPYWHYFFDALNGQLEWPEGEKSE